MRNYLREPGRYSTRQPSVRRQRRAVLTLIGIFAVIAILVLIVSSVRRRAAGSGGGNHYTVVSVNPPATEIVQVTEPPVTPPVLEATEEPTEEPTAAPTATPKPTEKPDTTTTLRPGDSGDAVARMQQRLIDLGYLDGEADGKYGNGTKKAVKAFQKKNKLTADGIAGKNTLTALYSDDAIKK